MRKGKTVGIINITKVIYTAAVYLPSRQIYTQSQHYKHTIHSPNRGVFRTFPNIYDGAFLQKQLTAKSC